MRRRWTVTVLVLLLFTTGGVLLKRCPRTVPFEQCSELYQRYADTEGVEASFIQGYRINDSVRVDVTLLQASDSAAWQRLMKDFAIPILPPEYNELVIRNGSVSMRLFPKGHPERNMDTTLLDNDYLIYYRKMQNICIFHIDDEAQISALTKHKALEYETSIIKQ
ncbi:MAG: hypothetical protein IK010_04010 [Bacteroidales bacterium]|nr:hypothetical protein [Bacteroidales bacterium]